MKKFIGAGFIIFYTMYAFAQTADAERMLQALKQSGMVRQEGRTIIYKAQKASDTARVRLLYGKLFANANYNIRFEVDGKYFDDKKKNPAKGLFDTKAVKPDTTLTALPGTKTVPVSTLATTPEQLHLVNGSFLLKRVADYRYLTYLNPADRNGRIPVLCRQIKSPSQQNWNFILQPAGLYKIKSASGLFLKAVENPSKQMIAVLRDDSNEDGYLWQLKNLGDGIFSIISKDGHFLEYDNRKTDGASVSLNSTRQENAFRKWHLIKIDGRVTRMTRFNPIEQGFHFVNSFPNILFLAGGTQMSMGGRCAGMVWAALDHYYNSVPIPSINTLPNEGSTLSTYIAIRQERSTHANIDDFAEIVINPFGWRTTEVFNWGLQGQNNGKMARIKASIDAGKPIPIMLFHPSNMLAHHSVLAIGYSMGRYTGDLRNYKEDFQLYVYDPNYPDEIHTLIADLSDAGKPRFFYPTAKDVSTGHGEWLTYFPSDGYIARSPLNTSGMVDCPNPVKQITGKNYRGTTHDNESFKCAVANRADFYGATFRQVDFENAKLDSTNFYGANLRNTNFTGTSLKGANFYGADLKDTRFIFVRAVNTNFEGADMKITQLTSSEIINSTFIGADLHKAILTGANFTGSDFTRTSLSNTICENTNFSNTILTSPNFQNANLKGAIFRNARLYNVDFRNTDLSQADFSGAIFWGLPIKLDGAILEGVIGLAR